MQYRRKQYGLPWGVYWVVVAVAGAAVWALAPARGQDSPQEAMKAWEACIFREADGMANAPDTSSTEIADASLRICDYEESQVRAVAKKRDILPLFLEARSEYRDMIKDRVIYMRVHGRTPRTSPSPLP